MMKSSRYIRPASAAPMRLQPRDKAMLLAVFKHRYLSLRHLQLLFFEGVHARAAQSRLRKLWSHGYLGRHFVPFFFDGTSTSLNGAGRPLYCLARKGAEVVSVETGQHVAGIPHTPAQNAVGFATLKHHLVVTDFLVALDAAIRQRNDIELVSVQRETELRRSLAAYQDGRPALAVVSDGAFTVRFPESGTTHTFHVEIVRAGTRGGNKTLVRKLDKYANLHHDGFFRKVYGHKTVRAVLIATTSQSRALRLRDLAAELPFCRGLFWFGTYDAHSGNSQAFTHEHVLDQVWHGADGNEHTILSAGKPSAGHSP